jgi:hypothetical protein
VCSVRRSSCSSYGDYPFAFSEEAVAAARAAGIELGDPEPDRERVDPSHGARPARAVTAAEYDRLVELGVLGGQVELIGGRIVFGRFPFVFSGEAIAAARAAGIELDPPNTGLATGWPHWARHPPPQTTPRRSRSPRWSSTPTATLTRAELQLARAGAERNDSRLLAARTDRAKPTSIAARPRPTTPETAAANPCESRCSPRCMRTSTACDWC